MCIHLLSFLTSTRIQSIHPLSRGSRIFPNLVGLCHKLTRHKAIFLCLQDEGRTYETKHGLVCKTCKAGTYVKGDCREPFGTPDCAECPDGTFSSLYTSAKQCQQCQPFCFDLNEELVKCNKMRDTICKCRPGYERKVDDEVMSVNYCHPISKKLVRGRK